MKLGRRATLSSSCLIDARWGCESTRSSACAGERSDCECLMLGARMLTTDRSSGKGLSSSGHKYLDNPELSLPEKLGTSPRNSSSPNTDFPQNLKCVHMQGSILKRTTSTQERRPRNLLLSRPVIRVWALWHDLKSSRFLPTLFPLMSTSFDSRRRTGIWSYIPFGSSSPRRRSVSLPYRADGDLSDPFDPFEKPNRHSSTSSGRHSASPTLVESLQNAWMTQSQRSRFFKTGGVLVVILFTLFYVSGSWSGISDVGSTWKALGRMPFTNTIRQYIQHLQFAHFEMHETAR